jgi:two-component system LytT family response regulator
MSKLRLLIVDDEPLIRMGIRKAASRVDDIEIIGECCSGAEAIHAISTHRPDLVLLDIQMPDCSGLDVIRAIGTQHMPPVIFITAYDEYAVKAFELNVVDYLLKPFDEERLHESIGRARQRIAATNQGLLAQRLEALLQTRALKPNRLVVRNGDRYEFVSIESIDWIESANNFVEIHCGPKHYLLGETLTSLEDRLDSARFTRIHRSRIVNISRIIAVHPLIGGTYEVELHNGSRLTTGRQYKEVIRKLIHDR